MNYPETIENLIVCFKKLPGIGEKTAERLSFSILNLDDEIIKIFSKSLVDIKANIKRCKYCNCLTENEICEICKNEFRNKKTLCIVSDPKDIYLFEKMGKYDGTYFVLNNLISPINGINPENLNIEDLIKIIANNGVDEIILALKPSLEGETTSLYLSKKLYNNKIKISKIAQGIPMGAEMEYVDSLTLELAFENRIKI